MVAPRRTPSKGLANDWNQRSLLHVEGREGYCCRLSGEYKRQWKWSENSRIGRIGSVVLAAPPGIPPTALAHGSQASRKGRGNGISRNLRPDATPDRHAETKTVTTCVVCCSSNNIPKNQSNVLGTRKPEQAIHNMEDDGRIRVSMIFKRIPIFEAIHGDAEVSVKLFDWAIIYEFTYCTTEAFTHYNRATTEINFNSCKTKSQLTKNLTCYK